MERPHHKEEAMRVMERVRKRNVAIPGSLAEPSPEPIH